MLFEKQLLIKSENGFSLVEVLVAMGIAGVVSLGVMRINQNMIKGQRSAEQRANKLDVQAELSRLIAAQTVCDASLRGLTIDATPPTASTGTVVPRIWTDINNNGTYESGTDREFYRPGGKVGEGSTGFLTVNSIRLGGFNAIGPVFNWDDPATAAVETISAQRGAARIFVEFSKPEGQNTQLVQ